jgi:hypothetical protein
MDEKGLKCESGKESLVAGCEAAFERKAAEYSKSPARLDFDQDGPAQLRYPGFQ